MYKLKHNPFSPVQFKQQTRDEGGGDNFESSFKRAVQTNKRGRRKIQF
jgi:hypothetical protein